MLWAAKALKMYVLVNVYIICLELHEYHIKYIYIYETHYVKYAEP